MDSEKREYRRDTYFTETKISTDGENWEEAEIFDISAGGLKVRSEFSFEINDDIHINLIMPKFLSKSELPVMGKIRRKGREHDKYIYGVAFINLSPEMKICIDENIMLRDRLSFKKRSHLYSD